MKSRLLDPNDALRFLVEFAQIDLELTPMRKLRQAAWGVQLLINRETPGHWAKKSQPDRKFLTAVQQRARALIEAFVKGPATVEGDLLLTFVITRNDADEGVRVYVHGSPLDLFLYQVVRVLETGGAEKLLKCPASDCGRIFLKVTKKRFCSTRCQSRTYMRDLRKRERQEKEAFHGKTTRTQ